MSAPPGRRRPLTFWTKAVSAAALVALADHWFVREEAWALIGGFALSWTALTVWTHPEMRRDPRARLALVAALVFALLQFDYPNLLGLALFWIALTGAVLLPRTEARLDAWRWGQRLAFHGLASALGPLPELRRLKRTGRTPRLGRAWRLIPLLALPLGGGILFLALFAAANPLIEAALARLQAPRLELSPFRLVFQLLVLILVWGAFRPRRRRRLLALPAEGDLRIPGVTAASITLSLALFNAIFALQNGLDLVYLWGGAGLPAGVTLAEYAHRGAYPLIATALLAGLFVLVLLSPGSEAAQRPVVRRLVVLWVAQNVLLVASTMLRTLDYVQAYALTPLRIAALAWMVLVALGLGLICWRMLKGKSACWLLNANTGAALVALVLAAFVDLNGAAAAWNVRHAREAGGRGAALDVCYLRRAGGSALVPLLELETRTPDGPFRDRLTYTRRLLHAELEADQSDWRSWTGRGARQLARAGALERRAGQRNRQPPPGRRACDGSLVPPPPVPPAFAPAPAGAEAAGALTPPAQPPR